MNRAPIDRVVRVLLSMAALWLFPSAVTASDRKHPDELPSVKELPDPFVFRDGARVKSTDEWNRRRVELRDQILAYEYGHVPPAAPVAAEERPWTPGPDAAKGEAKRAEAPIALPAGATEKHFILRTGPTGTLEIPMVVTRPEGQGPFPTIIRGDLCWGRVTTPIAAAVVGRGYMLVEFDRNAIVPDDKVGRDVGLYAMYPEFDFGALSAWAWGYSRVVDYLLTRDDVQRDHIAITGHSRGGKTVLLAGALDERVALTAPNNSGCGGAGCYRFANEKSETIDAISQRFPYWFQADFGQFVGKIDRLPIDQHSVKALVAPRALLSTEALGDRWANPEGSQQSYVAAKEVFQFLGVPENAGIVFREGGHEHGLQDWNVLLDFADARFFKKAVDRNFDQRPFAEAPKAFSWMAPKP